MTLRNFSVLIILLHAIGLKAQVTYAEHIAPLIYENCGNCHRPGEIGPFSLTNYEEVSNQAQTIKYVTEIRYMPPWQPDPDFSSFIGESFLTQEEIDLIGEWVDAGMPRGDITLEPDFPDYPEGSLLGEPDLVLNMEEAHLHRGDNSDSYYYFVLPTGLTEDRIVKAVEFRPGNPKIVHHALIFEDLNGVAAATDATTPEYGFPSFGGFNGDDNDLTFLESKQFQPYAPGQNIERYPDGLGQVMKAGADLAVQIHYAPSPVDEIDQSSINIFFADDDEEVTRFVQQDIFLPFQLPGGFFGFIMPPNQVSTFVGSWRIDQDLSLFGIFPHSHLLGKEWEVWLEHRDGSISNLIKIPDWDFNWQSQYTFDRYIKAEAGSTIFARAVYDNTVDNPYNPNNPPRTVFWGDRTQDEMYYMPFLFVPYEDGDEDIVFNDSTVSSEDIANLEQGVNVRISPNPVSDRALATFTLQRGTSLQIGIYNFNGQLVRQLRHGEFYNTGKSSVDFKTNRLDAGIYFLRIEGEGVDYSTHFLKVD